MKIENGSLVVTVDGVEKVITLPKYAVASRVKVWRVPVEYRTDGVFVSISGPGLAAEDVPACNLADCTLIGELDYPADDGAALEATRAQRLATLVDALNAAHAALGAGVSTLEQATWPTQLAEALALTACPPGAPSDSPPPCPLLTLMAAQRGQDETPRNLAERVLAAAARYTAAAGALVAWGQRTERQLVAAADAEALMSVSITPPAI